MKYDLKDKLDWIMAFVCEFARKYNLDMKQTFNYLKRFGGIAFIERNYDFVHTQSFLSMLSDVAELCCRNGGGLK